MKWLQYSGEKANVLSDSEIRFVDAILSGLVTHEPSEQLLLKAFKINALYLTIELI